MTTDFILRHFTGFALQLAPATALLLLPYDKNAWRIRGRYMIASFAAVLLGICAVYTLMSGIIHVRGLDMGGAGYLFGNLFMCAGILIIFSMFFILVRDEPFRKGFIFFSSIAFAAVQYCLVNVFIVFAPQVPDSQAGQSYDMPTVITYLIVTVLLFPSVAVFFRRTMRTYLKNMHTAYSRREFALLIVTTILYLLLNALLSMFWIQFHESIKISQAYYVPVILLLTAMLFIVYYSVIRLSGLKALDSERKMEAAVMRMDHDRIRSDMEKQRHRLHDTRQLLRTLYMIGMSGDKDKLQAYYDEAVEHISIRNESFCLDSRMNSILQYYASLASSSGITMKVSAKCADLSAVSDADLTVLMGNVLENAIRACTQYIAENTSPAGSKNPSDIHETANSRKPAEIRETTNSSKPTSDPVTADNKSSDDPETANAKAALTDIFPVISLVAEQEQDMLKVQIENSCAFVRFKPGIKETGSFLPANAFHSTTGGGSGLGRISAIASEYDGMASFCFKDAENKFITRIVLMLY